MFELVVPDQELILQALQLSLCKSISFRFIDALVGHGQGLVLLIWNGGFCSLGWIVEFRG